MMDKLKLLLAGALAVGGLWSYYALSDLPIVVRVLAVAAGFLVAGAVAWWSEPGKRFAGFARASLEEVRKVVWPSRKETMQTTAAVFAFVVVMAAFLWVTDKTLEWVLYDLVLGWRRT